MEQETVKVFFYTEEHVNQEMKFATALSAGADIKSAEIYVIKPGTHAVIRTGLYVSIPDGFCMKVYPRSGISAKTSLIFKNTVGLIDADYRGREIFVMWHNLGDTEVEISQGERIAQAVIERVIPTEYIRVDSIDMLKDMGIDRGGGLGSTGK